MTLLSPTPQAEEDPPPLASRFAAVRERTERLARPLADEDCCIQSMTEASPTKWHLAHTTWFFEQFILSTFTPDYKPHDPRYNYLFNSYYNTVGPQHCRTQRGMLSRPTVAEVYDYRHEIDARIARLFRTIADKDTQEMQSLITLGINHEQQHQELLVTDLKHMLSSNPLLPAYHDPAPEPQRPTNAPGPLGWADLEPGVYPIGTDAHEGFTFDNERPRHRVFIEPCSIATRLVTNREYLAFIRDGGYQQPEHWLAMGWAHIQEHGWTRPIYWYPSEGGPTPPAPSAAHDAWMEYTLAGPRPLDLDAPCCHISYYEADAYARWCGARLPTEQEWEALAATCPIDGPFAHPDRLHPDAEHSNDASPETPQQLFGHVWQWTSSAYNAYPGFVTPQGALGEYNGKFMCNQYVLRGGSCATPKDHFRITYRNFFPPESRWQFAGIRLARDA